MNASNYMYFNRMGCAAPEQTPRRPFGAQAASCRSEMRYDAPPAGIRPWLEPSQVQMTGFQPEQAQTAKAPRPWTAGFQSGQVQMTGIQPPQTQAAETQSPQIQSGAAPSPQPAQSGAAPSVQAAMRACAPQDPQMQPYTGQPSQMEGMCLGMGERMCPDPGAMPEGCCGDGDMPFCGLAEQFPVGMGYVPMQRWQSTYSMEDGFRRGTIFPELDLPFMMGRCI